MNIIFLRHGEATDNVNKLISDKEIYWSTLTKDGILTVKKSLKNLPPNIDKIYVSPLPRTIETASYVSKLYPKTEVIIDNRIREIYHGKYTHQKNNEDLDNTRIKQINGDYFTRLGEYGENNYDIETRLSLFLKDIYQSNFKDNTIIIVSHGSITSYMKRILKIKTAHIQTGKVEIFNDVDFNPLFLHLKKLSKIKKEKINYRVEKIKDLNANPHLKKNLLKIAKEEFNNIEFTDQTFTSYIEGFKTKNLIQLTNPRFDNNIILVCFYKNFESFANFFMKHYLMIGIKNFVFIDNNSKDKTTEILKKYSNKVNISFWKINEESDCYKMCGWHQRIFEFYGKERFYLTVDSDELFIYPNYKKIKLDKFIEQEKLTMAKSLILDVYPNNELPNKNIEEYKYIDKGTYKTTMTVYGQRFYGGPCSRISGMNLSLQKIPLLKYTGKEVFANDHFYYPFNINTKAKLCTYLLHYELFNYQKNPITFYNEKISISQDNLNFKF